MIQTNKNAANSDQNLQAPSKEDIQKIETELMNTLKLGFIVGLLGVAGYNITLQRVGLKLLFLSVLIAAASYISGFFLGFLFGIPKRNKDENSRYNLNTNLIEISDWLTKIIIGLGLIEIKRIPGYLQSIGEYVQIATGAESSMKIFTISSIIYFTIFGLYFGYNYMRLVLSGQYGKVDDDLLQKFSKVGGKLNIEDITQQVLRNTFKDTDDNFLNKFNTSEEGSNQQLSTVNKIDENTKKSLLEYNQLLKKIKTEDDYTFEDWYYKGITAYDKQDFNKTIVYMQNALEKDPDSKTAPDAYLYIGLSYYELNLYNKAIEANDNIIKRFKNYPFLYLAYYNNGSYYDKLGLNEQALDAYNVAISLKADYAEAWHGKGYILKKMNRYDDALAALDKAVEINPSIAFSWYNRASVFAVKKDKEDMLTSLKKAIELNIQCKYMARTDTYFENYQNDEDFKKLIE